MKTIYLKLAASVLTILLALTMIVGATFAWFSFSTSPEIAGINVSIGGGRTILLAQDITEEVTINGEKVQVHYPGEFSSELDFAGDIPTESSYAYLNDLAGLSPVSTADGIYWMLPTYDEMTGAINSYEKFEVDGTLENANLSQSQGGHYIYLDFWIVSPSEEFDIHVSTDKSEKQGSYLIELPKSGELESKTIDVTTMQGIVSASARVGFLVNTDSANDATMLSYRASNHSISQYTELLGIYPEKGETPDITNRTYEFTIYEPNATYHPTEGISDGSYVITKPLSYNPYGTTISEEDVSKQVMVQEKNTWRTSSMLYTDYQNKNFDAYVRSGNFYKLTSALYTNATDGVVSKELMESLANAGGTAGATDDVKITTLSANQPQRIRMFIWLEGQDADCTNSSSIEESTFALKLELSGAN